MRKLEIKAFEKVDDANYRIVIAVTETPSWLGRLFGKKARYGEFETPRYPKYAFWQGVRTHKLLHELPVSPFLGENLTRLAKKAIEKNSFNPAKITEWTTIDEAVKHGKLPKATALK